MKWGMKKGDEMKGCPSNSGRRLYHFAQTIEGCQTTADRTLSTLTLTKPLLTHGLRSQARSSARASIPVLDRTTNTVRNRVLGQPPVLGHGYISARRWPTVTVMALKKREKLDL